MTDHFTFFASYYDSIEHLDNDMKAEFLDVLLKYALRDELPEDMSPVVRALFTMAKPNLDQSKARRKAGAKGGKQTRSKPEANPKQTRSKPEANPKQVPSEKDKDKDKRLVQNENNFALFWGQYPNKKNKKKAKQTWMSRKLGNGLFETVMASLGVFKESDEWTKDGGKFIPMPTTWLNGDRWEDEEIETEVSRF